MEERATMTCRRCKGLMLNEQLNAMEGDHGELWSVSACCVNCGNRDDAVIQNHRQRYAQSRSTVQSVTVQDTCELPWYSEKEESLVA